MYDILIINGKIINGDGNPWYFGDIGIVKDKIVKIGLLSKEKAKMTINACGRMVTPGFIDSHTHSDLAVLDNPCMDAKVMQGVTTDNVGLDGLSVAPIDEKNITLWRKHLSGLGGDPSFEWKWRSLKDYFDIIDAARPSINITSYVGTGTIRFKAMGMADRPASTSEIELMKSITAQAMEEGARGISTGLIYSPCGFQSLQELVEIAKIARKYDGILDIHMRSEADQVIPAIEEALEIGRQAEIPVLITHFKALGKRNWGKSEKLIQIVEQAREDGIDVTAAAYPYIAGSSTLLTVIPPWFQSQGPTNLLRMLREQKDVIKKDIREREDWENFPSLNGWENIWVASVNNEYNKIYEGKSIVEVAAMRKLDDPADAALDLLSEEELAVGMVLFWGDEEDVVRIIKHPVVGVITDGIIGGRPHPRSYGAYPRVLGRYVRERRILSLEDAIRKMTSLPAAQLRLKTKGHIAENYDADIVIFDSKTIIDNATYENPTEFPSGIDWVLVNGQVVVEKGKHIKSGPGRVIR